MADITDFIMTDQDGQVDSRRFLGEVSQRTGLNEKEARKAATAVLCVLSRRISGGEARKLAGELPAPIRSFARACHLDRNATAGNFGLFEFLKRVADHLDANVEEARRIVPAVFAATRNQLSFAERESVESQLPEGLKELWHSPEMASEHPPA
jgi:uncharacterized protein (DUF2267 family)